MLNYILLYIFFTYGISFAYHFLLLITLFFKKDIFPKIYNLYYGRETEELKLEQLSNKRYYKNELFSRGYTTKNKELTWFIVSTLLFPMLPISVFIILIIPTTLISLIEKEFKKYRDSTKNGSNEN
jgi:hypothetical protein